jgi:hypothetical protein
MVPSELRERKDCLISGLAFRLLLFLAVAFHRFRANYVSGLTLLPHRSSVCYQLEKSVNLDTYLVRSSSLKDSD